MKNDKDVINDTATCWAELSDDDNSDDTEEIRKKLDIREKQRKAEIDSYKINATKNKFNENTGSKGRYKEKKDYANNYRNNSNLVNNCKSKSEIIVLDVKAQNYKFAKMNKNLQPTYKVIDNDFIFSKTYDIYYTDPTNNNTQKVLSQSRYQSYMNLVGSFNKLSEFNLFHRNVNWANIPEGSVIAYCEKGIKPIWEDPMNSTGGRFVLRKFAKDEIENIFTKCVLAFLGELYTDRANYNLISLNVRPSIKPTDIQLWRRGQNKALNKNNYVFLSCEQLALDLQRILNPEELKNVTVMFICNSGVLQKSTNNSNKTNRRNNDYTPYNVPLSAEDVAIAVYDKPKNKKFGLPTNIKKQIEEQENIETKLTSNQFRQNIKNDWETPKRVNNKLKSLCDTPITVDPESNGNKLKFADINSYLTK